MSETPITTPTQIPPPIARPEKEGHYGILFVGVICFFKDSETSRLVLLPDGRNPDASIEPHFPSIVVDPARIKEAPGWTAEEKALGFFPLPKCRLDFSGAGAKAKLSADQHEANIPKLTAINARIRVDVNTPNAVVLCNLTAGTLEAFRFPGTDDDSPDAAVLSRLEVPHGGDVVITIESDEWPKEARIRTIVFQPGTEVALQNMSKPPEEEGAEGPSVFIRPRQKCDLWSKRDRQMVARFLTSDRGTFDEKKADPPAVAARDHFHLYASILKNVGGQLNPQNTPITIPRLLSNHPVFLVGIPISSASNRCGNQGCC